MNITYMAVEVVKTPSSAASKNFAEFQRSIQSVNTLYDTRINLIRNVNWKELEEIIRGGISRKYNNNKVEVQFQGNNFIAQNEAGNVIPFCPIIPCSYYPGGNTITCSRHFKEYESHWRQLVSNKQQSVKNKEPLRANSAMKTDYIAVDALPRPNFTATETRIKPGPLELSKRVGSSANKLPVPERNRKQEKNRVNVKTLGDGKKSHYNKQPTAHHEATTKQSTTNRGYRNGDISAKRRISPSDKNNSDTQGASKQSRPSTSSVGKAFHSRRQGSASMKSPLSSNNCQQPNVNRYSSPELVDLIITSQSQNSEDSSLSQLLHLPIPIQDQNISSSESEEHSTVSQDVQCQTFPNRSGEEDGLANVYATISKRNQPEQQLNPRDDILRRLSIYKNLFKE